MSITRGILSNLHEREGTKSRIKHLVLKYRWMDTCVKKENKRVQMKIGMKNHVLAFSSTATGLQIFSANFYLQ